MYTYTHTHAHTHIHTYVRAYIQTCILVAEFISPPQRVVNIIPKCVKCIHSATKAYIHMQVRGIT